jgi:hypothetical protein
MNFQNYTQTYTRPVAKRGLRQQLRSCDVRNLPGGQLLWKAAAKVMLLLLPFVLVISMFVGSAINSVERSIVTVDNQRHELMDENIGMLARKARLWAPDHVQKLAEEKLSLYVSAKRQVGKFNRRKGTFTYL